MNISRKNNSKITFVFVMTLICNSAFAQNPVQIDVTNKHAKIENNLISIEFDLSDGTYSGIDKSDQTTMFKEAWYRIGQGGWTEPEYQYKSELLENVADKLGVGVKMRVWYIPQASYDPSRFLDITLYQESPFFVIGWGVKNTKEYTVRARSAEVLLNGVLFDNQKYSEPRVLRGGAGAEPNFVESTWEIKADNSAMLTYFSKFSDGIKSLGGKVFTYFQTSMPSNDFALAHPEWMLNNDISLLYEDHRHARPLIRFDYIYDLKICILLAFNIQKFKYFLDVNFEK